MVIQDKNCLNMVAKEELTSKVIFKKRPEGGKIHLEPQRRWCVWGVGLGGGL